MYRWVDALGTVTLDTAQSYHQFAVVRQGNIGGSYRVQVGAGNISLSGTTMTGSNAGSTYTIDVTSISALSFKDNVGDVQIVRVVGIR